MKTFVKTAFAAFLLSSILYACSSKKGELLATPKIVITDTIKYSKDIVPIMQTYCASTACHDGGSYAPGNFNIYTDIETRQSLIIEKVYTFNTMPPSGALPIPDLEKAKLRKWLDEGAPNN